jgi:alkylhydroperoxidase family enzyme
VRSGPDAPRWTPHQQALLRACDEMRADGQIGEETWGRLAAELDDRLLIELCLLIGHYEMLAMTLNTLQVQLDPPRKRIG